MGFGVARFDNWAMPEPLNVGRVTILTPTLFYVFCLIKCFCRFGVAEEKMNVIMKWGKFSIMLCLLLFSSLSCAQKTESSSWYVPGYSEEVAMKYFIQSTLLEPIEGIWQSSDGFKYAIEKSVEDGRRVSGRYRVIVLETSHDGWKLGQIKGFIHPGSVENVYSFKYYTRYPNGTNTESQNVFLMIENPVIMSFTRIDGGNKVIMYRLYPQMDEFDNNAGNGQANAPQWTGSGIAIGKRYIATNNHVVEDAKSLSISGINGDMNTNYRVRVIATDQNNDLAIVKVVDDKFEGFNLIPYGFQKSTADVGTEIFVLGYPYSDFMGDEVKVTNGIISAKTGYKGDVSTYQMSAPIQPGNSGGPVFDYQGNLIGISVSGIKADVAQNVNYAIKLSYLVNLAESCSEGIEMSNKNIISSYSLQNKIKAISPFVVMFRANEPQASEGNSTTTQVPISSSDKLSGERLTKRAFEKSENGDIYGAYEDVCMAIKLSPGVENHFLRGSIIASLLESNKTADTDAVIESFLYCVDNEYMLEESYWGLSICYYHQKKYSDAILELNKVLRENKKNVQALFLRAYCKSKIGKNAEATIDYLQATKHEGLIDFDYGLIYNNLAYEYLKIGDLNQANDYIQEALRRDYQSWYIWDTDGELAFKIEDYQRCIKSRNNAITINHKDTNAYYYRGLAKVRLGEDYGAYQDYLVLATMDNNRATDLKGKLRKDQFSIEDIDADDERIVTSPVVKYIQGRGLTVKAVELTNEYTAIHFIISTAGIANYTYSINKESYITNPSEKKESKYKLITTKNCPISPSNKHVRMNDKVEFVLYFERIDLNCSNIDFIEPAEEPNMGWLVKGINLSSESGKKSKNNSWKNWENVTVVEDASIVEGMEYVKTVTKTTLKFLQKEAAESGCSVILITEINTGLRTWITGKLYRMP